MQLILCKDNANREENEINSFISYPEMQLILCKDTTKKLLPHTFWNKTSNAYVVSVIFYMSIHVPDMLFLPVFRISFPPRFPHYGAESSPLQPTTQQQRKPLSFHIVLHTITFTFHSFHKMPYTLFALFFASMLSFSSPLQRYKIFLNLQTL